MHCIYSLQSLTASFLYPIQEEWGVTPLSGACIEGNATTAALLIEKGAKVNYIDKVRLLLSSFIVRDIVLRYIKIKVFFILNRMLLDK